MDYNVEKSTSTDIIKYKDKLKSFQTEVQEGDYTKKWEIVRKADHND